MSESLLLQARAMANQEGSARPAGHVVFDGRHPKLLDHRGYALQIKAGHVDVFAVRLVEGSTEGARHHLFRVESGEIILDLQAGFNSSSMQVQVIAVGSPGAEALLVPRMDIQSVDLVTTWIRRLARLIAGANPSWDMLEVASDGAAAIPPSERRRGPARSIVWVSLEAGTVKPMGLDPIIAAGSPPLPLTSGMWIEAGQPGCSALRSELTTAQTLESFDRLSDVVVQRPNHVELAADPGDPLSTACRMVAEAVRAPFVVPPRPALAQRGFAGVVEIARTARLRVRRTLLRGEWWKQDAGPLVAWHGEERNPVALIRRGNRRYVMFDTKTGTQRPVDRSLALELAPEAVSLYPALPARPLRFRDLLTFSFQHSTGNFARIAFAVVAIGLLSLVTPLITNVLINSVIPRSELDQ